jgi:hypothetical protein
VNFREDFIQRLFCDKQEELDEPFHGKPFNHLRLFGVAPDFPEHAVAPWTIQSKKYRVLVSQVLAVVVLPGEVEDFHWLAIVLRAVEASERGNSQGK